MKQRKFLKTATPYLFIMPWIIGVFDHELF